MLRRRTSLPSGWPRPCCPPRWAQGAGANHKNPDQGAGARREHRRADREALGRSRGGLTSKIHLAGDSRCRPISRVTSAGQRGDSLGFTPVLTRIRIRPRGAGRPRTRPGRVLADKAYSSKRNRAWLRHHGIQAVIPERADEIRNRLKRGRRGGRPPAFDPTAYHDRNTIERSINKLKQNRAVATRYDKRDYVWRGTLDVASIRIWLRNPVP